jgi:hypothetical protein
MPLRPEELLDPDEFACARRMLKLDGLGYDDIAVKLGYPGHVIRQALRPVRALPAPKLQSPAGVTIRSAQGGAGERAGHPTPRIGSLPTVVHRAPSPCSVNPERVLDAVRRAIAVRPDTEALVIYRPGDRPLGAKSHRRAHGRPAAGTLRARAEQRTIGGRR